MATPQETSALPEPVFLATLAGDQVIEMMLAMGAELWATKDRLAVVEALLAQGQAVTNAAIEQYVPSAEQSAARKRERDRFVHALYGALGRDVTARSS